MHNYKDPSGAVFALSDEDIANGGEKLLPPGCKPIPQVEADSWVKQMTRKPTYQELRASEYPPMADYLDAIVKGDPVQMQAYIDACLAVKTKYPKK